MTEVACSLALTLALGACAGEGGEGGPVGARRAQRFGWRREGLRAGVALARRRRRRAGGADDLDAATERLMQPLGAALGGLSGQLLRRIAHEKAGDGYVIGAVGESRSEVERLLTDVGGAE